MKYKLGDKVIDISSNGIVEIVKVHSDFGHLDLYNIKFPSGELAPRNLKTLRPLNSFFKKLYGLE